MASSVHHYHVIVQVLDYLFMVPLTRFELRDILVSKSQNYSFQMNFLFSFSVVEVRILKPECKINSDLWRFASGLLIHFFQNDRPVFLSF